MSETTVTPQRVAAKAPKTVTFESAKTVCHVCGSQIGVGNTYTWLTISPRVFRMIHPACKPGNGAATVTPEPVPMPEAEALPEPEPEAYPEPATAREVKRRRRDTGSPVASAPGGDGAMVEILRTVTEALRTVSHTQEALRKDVAAIRGDLRRRDSGAGPVANGKGLRHGAYGEVAAWIGAGEPLYLHGPEGSGKSAIVESIAEDTGAPIFAIEIFPNSTPSAVFGYQMGDQIIETPVTLALKAKGTRILLVEEADFAADHILAGLHPILDYARSGARRPINLPGGAIVPEGKLIIVATGNTAGFGGTILHPGRRPFDSATASRFVYLEIGYDEALEAALVERSLDNGEATRWLAFARAIREECLRSLPRLVISMRTLERGAKAIASGMPFNTQEDRLRLAKACMFRGIKPEDVTRLISAGEGGIR